MDVNESYQNKTDIGLLFLRAAGLLLFFTFGLQKLDWTVQYIKSGGPWSAFPLVDLVRKVGFPLAPVLTAFAILCESVFSLFVALGIYTRVSSILIVLGMMGALYTSICIHDPIISKGSAIQYILIFGVIAIMGPGKFTVGRYLRLAFAGKSNKT
jgi:uncharacterized membrane protein YphA (DoxX/SURF4 family)